MATGAAGAPDGVCYSSGVKPRDRYSGSLLVRGAVWATALFYAFWLLRWSVRPEHFFFADDWDWLYRAALFPLREQLTFLPRYVMNDRPLGALAIRAMYRIFGLNATPFYWMCLILHGINMTLLLALARRLMRSWWAAAAVAAAFGAWSAAIEGATWIADIFDVLGDTLILAVLLTFAARRPWVRAGSVALFYLALRTKEAAIVLPAMLVVMVAVTNPRERWLREAKRTLWPHVLLALFFAAIYAPMLAEHQRVESVSNPYRMVFTPRAFFEGLYFYVSSMLYGGPWPVGRLIRWSVAMAALIAGVGWRARATLAGIAGFVIFLGPIIFMAHQRQVLYLYIPAGFFALALGGAAEEAAVRLPVEEKRRERAAVAMILLCVVALPHRTNMRKRAEWQLEHTARARLDLAAFRAAVPALRPNARVALIGFPDDYHVFQTPGCSVLKVVYGVDPVRCEFVADGAGADAVVVWRKEGVEVTAGGK